MARVQLALNVPDLDEAVGFYSTLFGVAPHKRRDGYANFAIADPPLKLVLLESDDAQQLNHLGVELASTDDVGAEIRRLGDAGLALDVREQELCCHAVQDKAWVGGTNVRWEVYAVTDDTPDAQAAAAQMAEEQDVAAQAAACC